jgi:glycosyltransferase involved in cell wall biosynthesis
MKSVLHISYSETGGAGHVAKQLTNAQSSLRGYESRFLYSSKESVRTKPFENVELTTRSLLDMYFVKKSDWPTLFSMYRNIQSKKIEDSINAHDGIIHLHWLNGVLNLSNLSNYNKIGKKLIWTIHDFEPFTGGCHYAFKCENYVESCENCPAVRDIFKTRVKQSKILKNQLFADLNRLMLVFPSKWMLNNFRDGNPQKSSNFEFIPNPLPSKYFSKVEPVKAKAEIKQPLVFGFVSRDLNDPIKQFALTLYTLQKCSSLLKRELKLIAIGSKFRDIPKRLNFEIHQTGIIQDLDKLHYQYSQMDLLISNSIAESFGLTIAEAAACGVPSLVLEGSGSSELVIHNQTGILYHDQTDLIKQILNLAEADSFRLQLASNAKRHAFNEWHIDSVVKSYDALYDSLV